MSAPRPKTKRWVVIVVVTAAMAACHNSTPDVVPFLGRIGVYRFAERIAAAPGSPPIVFEGEFTVLGDTVTIDATPLCRYDKRSANTGSIFYACGDVNIAFDRRKPAEKVGYSAVVRIPVAEKPTCSNTVRRNCVNPTDVNPTERIETRRGILTVQAVR